MASASGVMGRCITTLGRVCAARSLSRMGWSCARQSGECSLTGMARSAFSRCIAFVLEGREWYSGASSCGSRGPSKVSTLHGGGGPGRAVRCHSKLSAALRSWEMGAGAAVPLMAMPPRGVQVPLCQGAGLFCAPYRVGSRVSHPSCASSASVVGAVSLFGP